MSENNIKDLKLTKEEKERHEEQEEAIKQANAPAKTNILNNISFKNELDKQVFNMLPLSDEQKEELIFGVEFGKSGKSFEEIRNKKWSSKYSGLQQIKEEVTEELENEELEDKE